MSDIIIINKSYSDSTIYQIEVIGQTTKRHLIHTWIEENIPSYERISHDLYLMKDEEYVIATKIRWG